jgi:hypothetical protein
LGGNALLESVSFCTSDDHPKRRVEQVTGLPFAFELAVA